MSRFRRRIGSALAGAFVASVVLAAPVAAVTPITFNIYVNSTCQYGTGQANTNFTVRLLAPNGDLVARVVDMSDGAGNWGACFGYPAGPGDKIRAVGGGDDRTVTIPNLRLQGNRVTDKVTGHWVANFALSVCVTHYSSFQNNTQACLGTTSSGTGSFGIDFTPEFNVRGGDFAGANYSNGTDMFNISMYFPYMAITRGDPYVYGNLNRGKSATIELQDGSSNVRGSTTVSDDQYGNFDGYFYTSSGNLVRPQPGNVVIGTFASDANITIPAINVSGVAGSDVVSGKCMPNRPYKLYARKLDYSDNTYRYGTTDGSGNFATDVTADIDLAAWDVLDLSCMYTNGDQVRRVGYVS